MIDSIRKCLSDARRNYACWVLRAVLCTAIVSIFVIYINLSLIQVLEYPGSFQLGSVSTNNAELSIGDERSGAILMRPTEKGSSHSICMSFTPTSKARLRTATRIVVSCQIEGSPGVFFTIGVDQFLTTAQLEHESVLGNHWSDPKPCEAPAVHEHSAFVRAEADRIRVFLKIECENKEASRLVINSVSIRLE